jgi:hypothetical protein
MIYSRFGSEVKELVSFDEETGEVVVLFVDSPGGEPERQHVSELKADGGIHEIAAAAKIEKAGDALAHSPEKGAKTND